jgi:hypothetical protein
MIPPFVPIQYRFVSMGNITLAEAKSNRAVSFDEEDMFRKSLNMSASKVISHCLLSGKVSA